MILTESDGAARAPGPKGNATSGHLGWRMLQDGDGAEPESSGAPERGTLPPETSAEPEIRALRDEVRRLREQVAALAARTKVEDLRTPTHVRGLDAALQGGVPRGHVVGI